MSVDLDRAEILTPSSLLVCSSFQFLNRNRSIDVAPTSSRCRRSFCATFFCVSCLPDSIHSTMVAHPRCFTLIFFRHFRYIFISRRGGSKWMGFSCVSILLSISRKYFSRECCGGSGSFHVTFSRFEWRKVGSLFQSSAAVPSLFVSRCRFP